MSNSAKTGWRLAVSMVLILAVGFPAWAAEGPTTKPADTKQVARRGKPKAKPKPTKPEADKPAKPEPKEAGQADKKPVKPAPKKPAAKKPVAKKPAEPAKPHVAHIMMKGMVLSSPPEFSLFAGQGQGTTLREWLQRLAKARNDDEIDAVALELGGVGLSWAQAQELADAVRRLNAVKPVYAHITAGGATQYLVGSAARELTMDPAGGLMITGLAAEMVFYRGTLDHIGVEPQLFQIGRYKGAAEPMTRTGPSEELKGEYGKILDDLYNQLCGQIASQRRLTIPHVRYAVDNGPFRGETAHEYKLVDKLVEKSDWKQHVVNTVTGKKKTTAMWHGGYGAKKPKSVDFSNPFALLGAIMGKKTDTSTKDPTVAIIHADGMIVSGSSGSSFFGDRMVGDKTLARCFGEAADDDNIKAVILRIDSPGGSALASEMIYQAVRRCAKKKPVIASIVNVGASGGYYIAVGAQTILADASAITGSIGVVGGKMATTKLMGKLGMSTFEITRGRNAGLWTSRPWNDREQQIVKEMMEHTYRQFTDRVREGRGRRIRDLDKVAQGRIFTARQAVKNGLIDKVGGLRDAVAAAQKAAKIQSSHIIVLPRPKTLADMLAGDGTSASLPASAESMALRALLRQAPSALTVGRERMRGMSYMLSLAELLATDCVLTAMPYHVNIKP